MPSSDLILAENGCSSADGGGRFVRIVTCVDGWVCIVLTHYDRQLHGGIYPVGANGKLVDEETGRPHLERALVSGVELLRCVCYQLARCDDFAFAVQVAYEEAGENGDPSGGGGGGALTVLTADNAACYLRSSDNRIRVICPRYLRQITPSLPSLMLSEADNAKFCVIWRASCVI